MSVDEAERHEMLLTLERHLGKEATMTLARHLPPAGWGDVATRQQLADLDERVTTRIDSLDERLSARIDSLDERLSARIDGVGARIDGLGERIDNLGRRTDTLEERMNARFDHLDARFDEAITGARFETLSLIDRRFADQTRFIVTTCITSMFGFGGMIMAGIQLAR